jgi:hypothetical protein
VSSGLRIADEASERSRRGRAIRLEIIDNWEEKNNLTLCDRPIDGDKSPDFEGIFVRIYCNDK